MTIQPNADFADATVAELRRRIPDLNERIQRQEKRIQKVKVAGAGPCVEMEALLMDMLGRRDAMQSQLADLESPPVQVRPAERNSPKLRLLPSEAAGARPDHRAINKGWHIELFRGGVRLQKASSRQS